MAKTNLKATVTPAYTAEGAQAYSHADAIMQLRRAVLACLLWEDAFYESGVSIAERIKTLVAQVPQAVVSQLAIDARSKFNLRHVPLLLVREMARGKGNLIGRTLSEVIQRADELSEFLSLYWTDKRQPLSKQVKVGLAHAFQKFSAYNLAKYRGDDKAVKLKDVLFLCHAKPKDDAQALVWKKLIDGSLQSADTWEVSLSAGKDKKETFERLIREGKLGYLALLRNLRNMESAGCDPALINNAILARAGGAERVLPFRFIAAAKAAPHFEPALDQSLVANLAQMLKLPGKTICIIDVSGSMYGGNLSKKSDMSRAHAACALGAIVREVCEEYRIYATAGSDAMRVHKTAEVPARRGMALVDAIYGLCHPLGGGGIFLNQVIKFVKEREKTADRIIVITDEQDCAIDAGDSPLKAEPFGKTNYMINVSTEKNGIGYQPRWTHIDGFSEAIMTYIRESESANQN